MGDETKALTCYFGYGSNMNRGIFESRRGMRPLKAQPALLENYRLRFNLAIGAGERGVANLECQAGARTWGVLYLITVEQSERLDRMEGVPRGAYRRIPVSAMVDGVSRSQRSRISQTGSALVASPLALHRLVDRRCYSASAAARLSPLPAKFRVGRGRAAVRAAAIVRPWLPKTSNATKSLAV